MPNWSDPHGIALDSAGNLYIADVGARRVRKVANGVIATVAGGGASRGDNGLAISAVLSFPEAVALDSVGTLYIADPIEACVRRVSNGVITTVAGGGPSLGDNGPATNSRLSTPMAVDSAGSLYIADSSASRIRKVANGLITTVAGNGSKFSGDNGLATSAQISTVSAIALDTRGDVYIADRDSQRVRKVSKGVITTVVGNGTGGDGGPARAHNSPISQVSP